MQINIEAELKAGEKAFEKKKKEISINELIDGSKSFAISHIDGDTDRAKNKKLTHTKYSI